MATSYILDSPGGFGGPPPQRPVTPGPVISGYRAGSGQYGDPLVELARAVVAQHNTARPLPLPYAPQWGDDSYVSPADQQAAVQRGRHVSVGNQGPAPMVAHGPLQSGAPRTSTNAGRIQNRRGEYPPQWERPPVRPIPFPEQNGEINPDMGAWYMKLIMDRMAALRTMHDAAAHADSNRPQGGSMFPPGYAPPGSSPPPLPPGMFP